MSPTQNYASTRGIVHATLFYMEQSLRLGLVSIAVSCIIELLLYVTPLWSRRRGLAAVSIMFLAFGTGYVIMSAAWVLSAIITVLCIYKGFSVLRLIEGRTNVERLKHASFVSYLWLTGLLALVSVGSLFVTVSFSSVALFFALGGITLGLFFFICSMINMLESRPDTGAPMADRDLPTVTIAIPARNETESLEACLIAALSSDYPKLEIIVLDDCSQDKTAAVIKSFAHEGVRFVLGQVAPEDWLAKNYAYKQLLDEASGEYVLFMGVDIRLHATSVRSLVQAMTEHKQTMVSVLPRRTKSGFAAILVQPMRYFWELAIARKLKKWPPVLSSCWMIDRKAALKAGGFEAVKRAILPERHFARDLGSKYAFKRTSETSVITTHKDFASQWSTAIRTRYPQLHRRPELVAFQMLGLLAFVVGPFILIFTAPNNAVRALSLTAAMLITATHVVITVATNRAAVWLAPFTAVFSIILDLIALNTSMYLYEFREVYWKGRNVCVPVMQTIPKLPKIE